MSKSYSTLLLTLLAATTSAWGEVPDSTARELNELIVVSRLEAPATKTVEIGAKKLTVTEIINTPVMFGEADVIKALQLQPGITETAEGMAGMHVHGGGHDENLYMLENVPLYQVNHFAGLFSAFNTDALRYIDFYKSSIPGKYDGRLSSFLDVRLKDGNTDGHHGSFKLGLTSGAFNISGPIGQKTTYMAAVRRSWFDVLTIPAVAILNSINTEGTRLKYSFTDLNAKVTHRFSPKAKGFINIYFGDDLFGTGYSSGRSGEILSEVGKLDFHWGNLVTQAGLNYYFTPKLKSEFTAAYTRFFSDMSYTTEVERDKQGHKIDESQRKQIDNIIGDWILRGDFEWSPYENSQVRFGANYTYHRFMPSLFSQELKINNAVSYERDSLWSYGANEVNAYIEDDWTLSEYFRLNAGLHGSIFHIQGKTKHGLSPRLSMSFRSTDHSAIKAAYAHTVQYVHQLTQTYLALPTDQWIPVIGDFKPQTADKISLGGYWQTPDNGYIFSTEAYYKKLYNLIEYRDEFYLFPPTDLWVNRLTSGKGTSKGIDFKVEKVLGKITGHIGYSLAWADRVFKDKNGGNPFPARFDNRHTINILVNWTLNKKVQLNAAWIGHSGNHVTLLSQMWLPPSNTSSFNPNFFDKAPVNNYQLPFYHRLDLSCTVKTAKGFWNFSIFNAYNHMNVISVIPGENVDREHLEKVPTFQKLKLLPIIPSVSYTWQF